MAETIIRQFDQDAMQRIADATRRIEALEVNLRQLRAGQTQPSGNARICASMRNLSGLDYTADAFNIIDFDEQLYAIASDVNLSTNRFTAPIAGWYESRLLADYVIQLAPSDDGLYVAPVVVSAEVYDRHGDAVFPPRLGQGAGWNGPPTFHLRTSVGTFLGVSGSFPAQVHAVWMIQFEAGDQVEFRYTGYNYDTRVTAVVASIERKWPATEAVS